MNRCVKAICKSAFFPIRNISRIGKFLSIDWTKTLVDALIRCRLDFCKSRFYGLPEYLVQSLQYY